jgi:trehalose-phosphatase
MDSKEAVLKPSPKPEIESFLKAVARAPQSLLMLDYDGTIAPFRKNRDQAVPYPGISALVQAIMRCGRTRVAVISGRDANEIIPLLDVHPRPELWGLHGLQRLRSDGSCELFPLDENTVYALGAAEDWLHAQHLRDAAEFKTGSIAVHWRGLSESDAEELCQRVLLGWKPIARHMNLHLLEFDGGVEIRAADVDKGDAVRTILCEMSPGTPAVYLGDDNTDEHAFEAMIGRGLSILVRPRYRATAAAVWLKPPGEVLDLLERWLQVCHCGHESIDEKSMAVNV